MPRYIAFLRAINVGGRVVKMDRLKECFESGGFDNVETFINSGNVIFETRKPLAGLETKIERHLAGLLGFETSAFLRTPGELQTIAAHQPFSAADSAGSLSMSIGFLRAPLDEESFGTLLGLQTPVDQLHAEGREIYWLCRVRQSDSKITNAVVERRLRIPVTFRNRNTVQRLAEKYSA